MYHHILVLNALQAEVHPSIRILPGQGAHIFCIGDCVIESSVRRFFARFQFRLCIEFFRFLELGLCAIHTNNFAFSIWQTQGGCGVRPGEGDIVFLPVFLSGIWHDVIFHPEIALGQPAQVMRIHSAVHSAALFAASRPSAPASHWFQTKRKVAHLHFPR